MVEQNARQALEIADKGYVLVQGANAYTDTGAGAAGRPRGPPHLPGGMTDARPCPLAGRRGHDRPCPRWPARPARFAAECARRTTPCDATRTFSLSPSTTDDADRRASA